MKIKNSELQIKKFNLLGINILSYSGDNENIQDFNPTNSNFELDFDFFLNSDNDNLFKIMVRLDNLHNQENEGRGYGIELLGEFKFAFDENIDISSEKKDKLMSQSALPMALSHLRSIIATTTSNFHYGPYYLPSIDLNDLYRKKQKEIEVELSKEVDR
ncbi:hypothetical protein Q2T41_12750 [Maribacter confluentis]|uniref:Preprotein translocase subunit SecB n=1 Tax=Maribacter confluentis TaxID=1656093 RepID=A0ABT8RRR6_9FLAO|nr:hypothetical protein [Maribacter confluentis]MDO1513525.1 hypothetical protein [Maribacter confluentis]